MVEQGDPMMLKEIAGVTGINASTALRMIKTMMLCGYVRKDPRTQRYMLTLKFAKIGHAVESRYSIADIVKPPMLECSRNCGEAVCFATEREMEVLYLFSFDSPTGNLRVTHTVGDVAPLHTAGIGKIMMLNYSDADLDRYIRIKGLQKFTKNTIRTKKKMVAELEKIRLAEYSVDNEESEIGIRSIAVGIRNYEGKYIGGVSVPGPISRITEDRIPAIVAELRKTAALIAEDVFHMDSV